MPGLRVLPARRAGHTAHQSGSGTQLLCHRGLLLALGLRWGASTWMGEPTL